MTGFPDGGRDVLERLTTVGGGGVYPSLAPDFILGQNEICKRKC